MRLEIPYLFFRQTFVALALPWCTCRVVARRPRQPPRARAAASGARRLAGPRGRRANRPRIGGSTLGRVRWVYRGVARRGFADVVALLYPAHSSNATALRRTKIDLADIVLFLFCCAPPPFSSVVSSSYCSLLHNAQSFSDYGGGAGTPGTRSSRSTPRGNGFASTTAPFSSTAGAASAAAAATTQGGGLGGGSTGKWESSASLGKQRGSSGTAGAAASVGGGEGGGPVGFRGGALQLRTAAAALGQQISAFMRDFIRGAGIHRLDPRRLSGERKKGFCVVFAYGGGGGGLTCGLLVVPLESLWTVVCAVSPSRTRSGRRLF